MTATANTLVIQTPGDYEINFNVLLNTSKPAEVGFAVRLNGTPLPQGRGSQSMAVDNATTLSYDGRLSGSTLATLAAGDTLDLALQVLRTLPSNLDAIVNSRANATLTAKKIGPAPDLPLTAHRPVSELEALLQQPKNRLHVAQLPHSEV